MSKKSNWTIFGILVLVLGIGYMPVLINAAYEFIFKNEISKVEVVFLEEVCDEKIYRCTKKYSIKIPKTTDENMALLVGSVMNPSTWTCKGELVFSSGDKDTSVSSRTTYNEFLVMSPSVLKMCIDNTINIKVTHPISQKNSGFKDSQLIISHVDIASKIKSAHEFFLRDYKIVNLFSMIIVLFFTYFIRIVSLDEFSSIRLKLSSMMMLGALTQSSLLEVFFPFRWTPHLNRWVAMLAFSSYVILAFQYLSSNSYIKKIQTFLGLVFFVLLVGSQDRIFTWIYFSFAASAIMILTSTLVRSIKLFVCGVLTLITSFGFNGVTGLPNSYIVPTFLALMIVAENNKAFLSFLKINRLLKLSMKKKSKMKDFTQYNPTNGVIRIFQRQFRIGRMTVLNIADPEIIHIQQYTKTRLQSESIELHELPPVFAHVVTTNNSLVNVHVDSKIVEAIRRGETKHKTGSEYFTVLPLTSGQHVVGALALTDYNPEMFKSALNASTFMFCLDILKGLLVENLLSMPKTESLRKISLLNLEIHQSSISNFENLEELIGEFGKILSKAFGWRVLSATIPSDDFLLKVLRCDLFDEEIHAQIMKGKIYAHKDNQQGPIAIAVHEKKTVIVPNTKWLEGVVHENTSKFFKIHKTKTAAFVPVIDDESKVVGVYWVEGVSSSEISYSDREMFNSFIKILSEKVKLMKSQNKLQTSRKSLEDFIPMHLVEDYLAGKDVVEHDHGFLMMFDLKGSTRLAHALGNANFHKEVEVFKDLMVIELRPRGWVLQQFVWDGFEFTMSSDPEKNESISVTEWEDAIQPIFSDWKKKMLSTHGDKLEITNLSYRICFSFGDISRGVVVEGATSKWALTGDAIAVVTKIEQASKDQQGLLFCDKSMLDRTPEKWVQIKTTSQGLAVYSVIREGTTKKAA